MPPSPHKRITHLHRSHGDPSSPSFPKNPERAPHRRSIMHATRRDSTLALPTNGQAQDSKGHRAQGGGAHGEGE
ncbi:hypothetical protein EYC84_000080 [Monilinia fructicola]|uniref:Uncharacterized protein n=1 Tax=Monilinia fructicola TaxID=38448 RepID=A0A5M9JSA6_MONFR|nr:hypothetical protein EYC84_000080 [Monilinia fructicola]